MLARLTRPTPRRGAARLALVLALALSAVAAPGVRAEDILELDGTVTDRTGLLADDTAAIEEASQAVLDADGVQSFVVFVADTDGLPMDQYAFETASANSLGVNDALIVVAIDDRTDFIWVADGLEAITDDELDEIIVGTLEPALADGEFGRAVTETIEALGVAADTAVPTDGPLVPGPATAVPIPDPGPGAGDPGDSGGISLGTVLAIALIGGGAFLLFRRWRRAPSDGAGAVAPPGAAPAELAGPALAQRATAMLIATDERIRDAQQEVGFAEAQYGADEVAPLHAAVGTAQGELREAFKVRQRLDDDVPEDAATRDTMLREIVERTTRAQDVLDRETERIRQLRDLERDAPNTLVELPGRIEAVEDRLPASGATFASLQRYAPTTWQPVAGHLEEAQKGLDGARDAVILGSASMSDADRSKVAVATREALEGVTGAAALLDAVDRLAANIAEAERRVPTELTEAEQDIADARAAADRGADPALTQRIAEADGVLAAARQSTAASPPDPLEALRLATEAHRQADALLLAARGAAEARTRLVAAADSSIRTAASEVDRAATFIAGRRPGVGEAARTRLAEAQRLLGDATALAATDPAQALETGRRAQALASEAYRLAESDFNDFDQGGPGWGQRSGTSGDQTAQILGQILGGIIGGAVRSGGGGGWGGSPWGSGGGGGSGGGLGGLGGGWGGGGGGFGSGGFGGGGGGGGGGGRGRGGRW